MFKKNKEKAVSAPQENNVLCDDLGFVLHEEYRLLRTSLLFSLADDKKSHCIGITSSIKGEAKSTTAINLAYALAENGEKACLVEGDMRLPTLRRKMNLPAGKGLSEYLTGQAEAEDVICEATFKKCSFSYIQAGTIPPNPTELLSSARMDKLLKQLSAEYAFIIIDLPPVTVVSDALALGAKLDGMIVAVAQPICTKKLLKETMRQLSLARIRVLGFVRTITNEQDFGYHYVKRGRHYRYHNYRYRYYSYGYRGHSASVAEYEEAGTKVGEDAADEVEDTKENFEKD